MDKKLIGNRLKQQRILLNLTREQFAEKIDISPQFLAEIENLPSLEERKKERARIDTEVNYFLNLIEKMKRK